MDDLNVTEMARITQLRNWWLLKNKKINSDLKACLKKAKIADQKKQAKLKKIG